MSSQTIPAAIVGAVLALGLGLPAQRAQAAGFSLWIAETPAGGTTPFNSQFMGGVRSYNFDGLGYAPANVTVGPLIAAAGLSDPSDVLRAANGDLLIADRGFNTGAGAVSRVSFTGNVPNAPTVALTGLDTGPHQLALTASGDLITSSLSNGGKLYPGVSGPSTTSFAAGAQRGSVVMGNLLYTSNASDQIRVFDISTGANINTFNLPGATSLHYGGSFGGELYFADVGSSGGSGGGVFKLTVSNTGNLLGSSKVANVDGAVDVGFSPSGDEMLVAGHFSGLLTGFAVTAGVVAASSNLTIDGGTLASWNGAHVSFGGMEVIAAVPEPASYVLMALGLLAVGVRVRRQL